MYYYGKKIIVTENLVCIEGGDASGKTLLINAVKHLFDLSIEHYDTVVATKIREILLDNDNKDHLYTVPEMLLYIAQRSQLHDEIISPALDAAKNIILSRYVLSTCAYQGTFISKPIEILDLQMNIFGMSKDSDAIYLPKKTILLKTSSKVADSRLSGRAEGLDRLENKTADEDIRNSIFENFIRMLDYLENVYGCLYCVIETDDRTPEQIAEIALKFIKEEI